MVIFNLNSLNRLILYSCVFASNYNKNFNYKLSITKQVENDILIVNNIILEKSKINT